MVLTRTTAAANYFEYVVKKGSVSDRLFHSQDLDPPVPESKAPPPPLPQAAAIAQIGEDPLAVLH